MLQTGLASSFAVTRDQMDRCREGASSGDSLIEVSRRLDRLPLIAAGHALVNEDAVLYAQAAALYHGSDFAGLHDPLLRDIAIRDHAYMIGIHLERHPLSPLAAELRGTLAMLHDEIRRFANDRRDR